MKQVLVLAALVALSGCSTVEGMMDAKWMQADWWGIESKPPQPLPPGGKKVKLGSAKVVETAPAKPTKGDRELRMSGLSADGAKAAAFKAAQETCAKDEDAPGRDAEVVKDKAGSAHGSFYHDVQFNCVKGGQ
jgi:hypothetical protein